MGGGAKGGGEAHGYGCGVEVVTPGVEQGLPWSPLASTSVPFERPSRSSAVRSSPSFSSAQLTCLGLGLGLRLGLGLGLGLELGLGLGLGLAHRGVVAAAQRALRLAR